jgi:hypothetical protein
VHISNGVERGNTLLESHARPPHLPPWQQALKVHRNDAVAKRQAPWRHLSAVATPTVLFETDTLVHMGANVAYFSADTKPVGLREGRRHAR